MRILTTGTASGMGRYIHENLGGFGLTRDTSADGIAQMKEEGVDVIIHCAFNSQKDITSESLYGYFNDNVALTGELARIPHKKMVFFSTVDLYPKVPALHTEDEIISLDNVQGIYATTKIMAEALVKNSSPDHLILRMTTPVGRYSRKNTLMKLTEGFEGPIYLASESVYNFVLYQDVLEFIKFAIKNGISGIFNIASTGNITLSKVTDILGRKVQFGKHQYSVGNISNRKAVSVYPAFGKTSEEVLHQFIREFANA